MSTDFWISCGIAAATPIVLCLLLMLLTHLVDSRKARRDSREMRRLTQEAGR